MADKTRFELPAKIIHSLGWSCATCFHVVKDTTPGSKAMKCARFPPHTQAMIGPGGQFQGTIGLSPPVTENDWCGEYDTRSRSDTN